MDRYSWPQWQMRMDTKATTEWDSEEEEDEIENEDMFLFLLHGEEAVE